MGGGGGVPQLAPAQLQPRGTEDRVSTGKKASVACEVCKRLKRRCDQGHPCQNCRKWNKVCVYDESLDRRRKVRAKRTSDELDYHRSVLNGLFESIRSFSDVHVSHILSLIRHNAPLAEITTCIDNGLAELQENDGDPESAAARERLLLARAKVGYLESVTPAPKSIDWNMDVDTSGDGPPVHVPARPWTTVTHDDAFVSRLISLWFTWAHQYHYFLDRELFLRDMRAGEVGSQFCSPFLVNCMLAQACHYSDDSEALARPNDPTTVGDHFFAEAKRLWDEEEGKVSLANVQGVYAMLIKATVMGKDRVGLMLLRQLNDMYRELDWELASSPGPSNRRRSPSPQAADEAMDRVSAMTAHSIIVLNATFGLAFLQAPDLRTSSLSMPYTGDALEHVTTWEPYPLRKPPVTTQPYRIFNELCKLTEIGNAVQDLLFDGEDDIVGEELQQAAEDLLHGLCDWKNQLPSSLDAEGDIPPTPAVFELHCYYYWIVSILFYFLKFPMNSPRDLPRSVNYTARALEICCSSAEQIAHLCVVWRNGYDHDQIPLLLIQATDVAALTLMDELGTPMYRDAFHEICEMLVSASRRWPLVRGKVRMVSLTAEKKGIRLPAATDELLQRFTAESWKPDDQLRFSSKHPNYAIAKETDDVLGAGMSDLLERWEGARRSTSARLSRTSSDGSA